MAIKRSAGIAVGLAVLVLVFGGGYALGRDAGRAEAEDTARLSIAPDAVGTTVVAPENERALTPKITDVTTAPQLRRSSETDHGRNSGGGNFAGGQVKSVSGDTIELSTLNEVLQVTDQTQFQKTIPCSLADIKPGTWVVIQGERTADGRLTARMIQIMGVGLPGGGHGTPGGQ